MKPHTITIVPTSRESIVKFETNQFLTPHTNYEFNNIEEAKSSPLATALFHFPFVKQIFISQNFVAINKYDIVTWEEVQDQVAEKISSYLNSGDPIVVLEKTKEKTTTKKVPITVYAESTPNPEVLKFVVNRKIVLESIEFKEGADVSAAPLVKELFAFPFVKQLFLDNNYISITKTSSLSDWSEVTNELREFIKSYLEQGKEIVTSETFQAKTTDAHSQNTTSLNQEASTLSQQQQQEEIPQKELDYTSQQIISILDEYIKPAVASDGGNILFKSYDPETKKVLVILQGACSGCPSSTQTLKNGIETMLKEMLPGKISEVEAFNG